MNETIKRNKSEVEFLEDIVGETEMVSDYHPEMVLDSIKSMCQQRFEVIDSQTKEERIKQKIKELLDLVPKNGHLSIGGFDMDELTIYKKKDIGVYSPIVQFQDSKIKG